MALQLDGYKDEKTLFKYLCNDETPKCFVASGNTIRVRFRSGQGSILAVLFHPAGPPNALNRPYFLPFLPLPIPQISISDPTLEDNGHLACGWYLGHKDKNLPRILSNFLTKFSNFLGLKNRIFIGGSSGGFAAALYASMDPKSLCIAVCPQTDLDDYESLIVKEFKTTLFPNSNDQQMIKDLTSTDLREIYSGKLDNSLIITVSPGDHHLTTQVIPLWQRLTYPTSENAVLDVRYHGVDGHGNSVPHEYYVQWTRAALIAKSWCAKDLLDAFFTLDVNDETRRTLKSDNHGKEQDFSDASLAKLLANWELNEGPEA